MLEVLPIKILYQPFFSIPGTQDLIYVCSDVILLALYSN